MLKSGFRDYFTNLSAGIQSHQKLLISKNISVTIKEKYLIFENCVVLGQFQNCKNPLKMQIYYGLNTRMYVKVVCYSHKKN